MTNRVICLPIISQPILNIATDGYEFVLMSGQVMRRFVGDTTEYAIMEVLMNGRKVAQIQLYAYKPKFDVSLNTIRWMGTCPPEFYDGGPFEKIEDAFAWTVKRCVEVMAYRTSLHFTDVSIDVKPVRADIWENDSHFKFECTISKGENRLMSGFGPTPEYAENEARWFCLNHGYRIA